MKYRRPRKFIAAAVSIDPELYQRAMNQVAQEDTNFSRYVRDLIRADIHGERPAIQPPVSTPK